jgi:membrane protein implicated in regulation of membrane protease activity
MEFILGILGALLAFGLAIGLVVAVLSALGVFAIGTLTERLADLLIPGRKTGLGADGIVGQVGVVSREFEAQAPGAPFEGTVQVAGELWRARPLAHVASPPAVGTPVRIVQVEGMVATVEHAERGA